MKLLPFNYEAIKAGAQAVTRDGRLVQEVRKSVIKGFLIIKFFDGTFYQVYERTGWEYSCEDNLDLFILDTSPVWRSVKDNPPSEKYGDKYGKVLVRLPDGKSFVRPLVDLYVPGEGEPSEWLPIPPLPTPEPDFQRDFLDKQKGTAAEELWNLLDADEKESIKLRWKQMQKKGGQ